MLSHKTGDCRPAFALRALRRAGWGRTESWV